MILLLHIRGQPFTSVLLLRFGQTANTSVGVEISSASPGQGSKHVENISEAINHSNNATKPLLLLLRSTKKICSNSVRESPFREMIFAKSNQDIILRSRAIGRDSTTSTIGDLEKEATTTYFTAIFLNGIFGSECFMRDYSTMATDGGAGSKLWQGWSAI